MELPTFDELMAQLQAADPDERANAAALLGLSRDPRAVAALAPLLDHDPDNDVRIVAAHALGKCATPAAIDVLLAALDMPDDAVQGAVAFALHGCNDPRLIDPLLARLTHPSAAIRQGAAFGLGGISEERVVNALLPLLRDGDDEVREAAAGTLAWSEVTQRYPYVVPHLIDVLANDPSPIVRNAASDAFMWTAHPAALPALLKAVHDEYDVVRQSVAVALKSYTTPEVVPALATLLSDDDALLHVSGNAASSLYHIGTPEARAMVAAWRVQWTNLPLPTFDDLMAQLQAADPVRRAQAAYLLGELGDRRAVAALIAALRDASPGFVYAAIDALGALGDERGVPPLIEMLKLWPLDALNSKGRRGHVIDALAAIGTAAVEPLIDLTRHPQMPTRLDAYFALALIEHPAVPAVLVEGLQDEDEYTVRTQVMLAIRRRPFDDCTEVLLERLPDAAPGVQHRIVFCLRSNLDPRVTEVLLDCLHHPHPEVAQWAAVGLTEREDERIGTALMDMLLLRWPDGDRTWLLRHLGGHSDTRILPYLLDKAHDPTLMIRQAALMGLGQCRAAGCVEVVLAALGDADEQVQITAARALAGNRDPRVVEALLAMVAHPTAWVRQAVVEGLAGWHDDPRVVAAWVHATADTGMWVQHAAAQALARLHDLRAVPALLHLLTVDPDWMRREACLALGHLKAKEGVAALIAVMQHDPWQYIREAAVQALGRIQDPAAVPALIQALVDHRARVTCAAQQALEAIGTDTAWMALHAWDEWRGR